MTHSDLYVGAEKAEDAGNRQNWVAAGGVLGAVAASSCCVLPLALFSLRIGGESMIADLTSATANAGFPSELRSSED